MKSSAGALSQPSIGAGGMERLVLAAGDVEFGPVMFDTMSRFVHADMYASFEFCGPRDLSLLFAGGTPNVPNDFPFAASCQYAQGFWRRDPLMRAILSDRMAECTLRTQSSDRIPKGDYRSFCYDEPGVLDRMSIFRRNGEKAVLLNFYRYRDSGHFSECDVNRVAGLSGLMTALVIKHLAIMDAAITSGGHISAVTLAESLRRRDVHLSERELAVCAAMLAGAALKEISRSLGVELSTAITYKRRAYDKLGISSRSELQALLRGRSVLH